MCGIVGLYAKQAAFETKLGAHLAAMLVEMSDRGPDSAGVALYRDPAAPGATKLVLHASEGEVDWPELTAALGTALGATAELTLRGTHAVVTVTAALPALRAWLEAHYPQIRLVSAGEAIEIFKEKGHPREVVRHFGLETLSGSHGLGHTRMATESAVTTEHSHPFSTGRDLCLVHNGSLSNHNRLRAKLRKAGVEIQTDNDSEVAAGYLAWRLAEGDGLEEALERAMGELDGFYTFAVGSKQGFAVLRDPIACKHAVLAETDDWVAMATEYRAIASLPGADQAEIWEPRPGQVYAWGG
ncbi:MAG: glutamine amidotransferase family protein [Rhodospirillales bacterium]